MDVKIQFTFQVSGAVLLVLSVILGWYVWSQTGLPYWAMFLLWAGVAAIAFVGIILTIPKGMERLTKELGEAWDPIWKKEK